MKRAVFFIFFAFAATVSNAQQNCSELPQYWKSENQAIDAIQNTKFEVSETIFNQNSWLTKASFFSCDGEKGYLLIYSDKKAALHQDVPVKVWELFKEAKSKGGYYNFYLKDKFKLKEPA